MIYDLIEEVHKSLGLEFSVGDELVSLDHEDYKQILEDAAKHLYSRDIGTQYERAGLIVQKTKTGFAVFSFIGTVQ